ncbi:hypothetical protein [Ktedonospora formicarum]|uniref:Uncharacterized protein n=1 Tax=Ktedonospora formicarum TaxID=2778364 RepID=A0A8J3MVZ4_9CHLR|nr:hypothetical protein [Ktedonospora formicarum]GHO48163.1 hypothetical protein KSX_63260 [Ktedonospora formicarum]
MVTTIKNPQSSSSMKVRFGAHLGLITLNLVALWLRGKFLWEKRTEVNGFTIATFGLLLFSLGILIYAYSLRRAYQKRLAGRREQACQPDNTLPLLAIIEQAESEPFTLKILPYNGRLMAKRFLFTLLCMLLFLPELLSGVDIANISNFSTIIIILGFFTPFAFLISLIVLPHRPSPMLVYDEEGVLYNGFRLQQRIAWGDMTLFAVTGPAYGAWLYYELHSAEECISWRALKRPRDIAYAKSMDRLVASIAASAQLPLYDLRDTELIF